MSKIINNFEVINKWKILEVIGTGKEGTVFRVQHLENRTYGALKAFPPKKSVKKIKKELDFHLKASSKCYSPKILSDWDIDENNKYFVMELLGPTLYYYLVKEKKKLNNVLVNKILVLLQGLDDLNILVNDSNILRNILFDSKGDLFMIDYGFAITKEKHKHIQTNFGLLMYINRVAKNKQIQKFIEKYEQEHNIIIDLYAHEKKKQQQRLLERLKIIKNKSKLKTNNEK